MDIPGVFGHTENQENRKAPNCGIRKPKRNTTMLIISSHLTTSVGLGKDIRICGAWRYCDWKSA
jgi:hypothetical protein